ncbi:hypothetical protein [Haladaptatus halobius]|uniref:hypothetical protein n=1 Tax=Haladaptatus halobius TaxID=2884875 RepID=UPI001D0BDC4A|nr:hypothetical protein [Haladaptatus halobius]
MRPPTRLFHLHFNTPDVSGAERRLAGRRLPLYRRFGQIDGEFLALDASDSDPDDFRLQNAQRGYVNVTIAPGRRPHFDHLGLCTTAFDALCDRAAERGWSVRSRDGRRTFVMTPWRFRVELHPHGSDVEADLGSWEVAHLERVELTVPDPDADDEFRAVFGDVPGLRIRRGDDVEVPRFCLAGSAFPDGARVETDAVF